MSRQLRHFDRLQASWEELDAGPQMLQTSGGRVLVSRVGARALAVDFDGDVAGLAERVGPEFWTPSALLAGAGGAGGTAAEVGGGSRLWIAPEIGWFWPSLELARQDPVAHAATPGEIDPRDYVLVCASSVEVCGERPRLAFVALGDHDLHRVACDTAAVGVVEPLDHEILPSPLPRVSSLPSPSPLGLSTRSCSSTRT